MFISFFSYLLQKFLLDLCVLIIKQEKGDTINESKKKQVVTSNVIDPAKHLNSEIDDVKSNPGNIVTIMPKQDDPSTITIDEKMHHDDSVNTQKKKNEDFTIFF